LSVEDYGVVCEVVMEFPVEVEIATVRVKQVESPVIKCRINLSHLRTEFWC
jgi:hypothetical protein